MGRISAARILALLAITTACDDRLPALVDSGPDASPPIIDAQQLETQRADTGDPGECVIAIRIDDCCQSAMPATIAEVQQDACFVLWPPIDPLDEACAAKWRPECDLIECMPGPPPSRVAARVDGACQFVDECTGPEDCIFATNMRSCCACADVYPPELVAQDACLVTDNEQAPASCYPDCTNVLCEQCIPPPVKQCAMFMGQFNTCRGMWPD